MGRLRSLGHRVADLAPRIGAIEISHDDARRDIEWRRWYKMQAWRRLRWDCLTRDRFTCQMCGVIEAETSQLVADHVLAHRGDAQLFWDIDNLQCLCKRCHDSDKQRAERAAGRGG